MNITQYEVNVLNCFCVMHLDGLITVTGTDGKPIKVAVNSLNTAVAADGLITVTGADGRPIKVAANSVNTAIAAHTAAQPYNPNLAANGTYYNKFVIEISQ